MVMQLPLDGGGPPKSQSHRPWLLTALKSVWQGSNEPRQRPQLFTKTLDELLAQVELEGLELSSGCPPAKVKTAKVFRQLALL